jgi:hypothetical protein
VSVVVHYNSDSTKESAEETVAAIKKAGSDAFAIRRPWASGFLRVGSQFFRHVTDSEVNEGAHARRQQASSGVDNVNG